MFSSSFGSCHGSDVTWQEISRMCGSMCSCPHPGSMNAVPPFRYAKVHKAGTPFRLIVDYIGSIGYNTSRFLADISALIVGKSEQSVKNLKHIADDLAGLHLEANENLFHVMWFLCLLIHQSQSLWE